MYIQALDQVNESVRCFRHCLELDPSGKMSREMYFAAVCEHRMNVASRERTEKLDDTQKKLDLFYSNMELVRKNQQGGVAAGAWPERGHGSAGKKEKKAPNNKSKTHADRKLDPNLNHDDDVMELKSEHEINLELELDEALEANREDDVVGGAASQANDSTVEIKRTRSNFRLVLKPLPPDDATAAAMASSTDQSDSSDSTNQEEDILFTHQCPSMFWRQFPGNLFCCFPSEQGFFSARCDSSSDSAETGSDEPGTGSDEPVCEGGGVACRLEEPEDELAIFEHMEPELNIKDPRKASAPALPPPKKEYPQDYHSLEFLPYNPLPDKLESAIFPKEPGVPLPLYHDPYWPRKKECLELVSQLKLNPHLIGFTGTFITPEARGAR